MKKLTDNALFSLMEWAMSSLRRLDHHHEQDIFEQDLRVDLLNLLRDTADVLNNPSKNSYELVDDAMDIAERMEEVDANVISNIAARL